MTRTFLTDSNNDIYLGTNGQLAIGVDLSAVLAAAQTAAQAQYGEMVLALDQGVPNFETIWSSQTNVAQFEAFLRRAILSVDGVKEIADLDIDVRDNALFYTAQIVSIFGSGVISNG